jgi:hypothetical protein
MKMIVQSYASFYVHPLHCIKSKFAHLNFSGKTSFAISTSLIASTTTKKNATARKFTTVDKTFTEPFVHVEFIFLWGECFATLFAIIFEPSLKVRFSALVFTMLRHRYNTWKYYKTNEISAKMNTKIKGMVQ